MLQSRFGDKPLGNRLVCPQIGTAVLKGLTGRYFPPFGEKIPGRSILFRVSRIFFQPRQNTWRIISSIAEKSRIVAEHRAGARCEPCRHSALYRIHQGHLQGHSQAVAGRSKRRAPRELYSSSRQSRLTDMAEISTKSPATVLSWKAFSRQKLIQVTLARFCCRLCRSRGTSGGTSGGPARAPPV